MPGSWRPCGFCGAQGYLAGNQPCPACKTNKVVWVEYDAATGGVAGDARGQSGGGGGGGGGGRSDGGCLLVSMPVGAAVATLVGLFAWRGRRR